MKQFLDIYRNKTVLITGHTGFKGSWLGLWLHQLESNIIGVSLPADSPNSHWDTLNLPIDNRLIDIRDSISLQKVFKETRPDVVFHLAAQPLVRRSYRNPLETWSTNVMGTANVLEACRKQSSVSAIVIITTDKCYENREWNWGYREDDRLGGRDPYSASKACAELLSASYRNSFFDKKSGPLLATARAGNVIGGGDWSEDRLIPDLVRAIENKCSLEIRSPHSTRPWQHVLESLSGYLLLGQKLLTGNRELADAWNFGPESSGNKSVSYVLGKIANEWEGVEWHVSNDPQPYESKLLYLDSAKARAELGWKSVWGLDESINQTVHWYKKWHQSRSVISCHQLGEYISAAQKLNQSWLTI